MIWYETVSADPDTWCVSVYAHHRRSERCTEVLVNIKLLFTATAHMKDIFMNSTLQYVECRAIRYSA